MNAGEQVRVARLARGLSQQRLAELAGVSARTVRSIERGQHNRPHRHSLQRIAEVFGFTASQTDRFLAAWEPDPSTARLAPVVGSSLDIDAYLGTGGLPLNHGIRVSTSSSHMFVGAHRQSTQVTQEFLVEARHDRVEHHWLLWADDVPLDLDRIGAEVTIGGISSELLLLPGLNVAALRVTFDPALEPGQLRRLGVRWKFSLRPGVDPITVPVFAAGWRDTPHVATVAVTFAQTMPARVWTVVGANPGEIRDEAPAALDATCSASVTRTVEAPGMLGVRWEWD